MPNWNFCVAVHFLMSVWGTLCIAALSLLFSWALSFFFLMFLGMMKITSTTSFPIAFLFECFFSYYFCFCIVPYWKPCMAVHVLIFVWGKVCMCWSKLIIFMGMMGTTIFEHIYIFLSYLPWKLCIWVSYGWVWVCVKKWWEFYEDFYDWGGL